MTQNNKSEKATIKDRLKEHKLICDGAFGTYYESLFHTDTLPELANLSFPERVLKIHSDYIAAGADLIRTNTFACNSKELSNDFSKVKKNIKAAYSLASKAAGEQTLVAADIGPIPCLEPGLKEEIITEYMNICDVFLECGADIFIFETFSSLDDIMPAIAHIKEQSDAFIIVQFSVTQYGYSSLGISAQRLLLQALECSDINATGLNCGVGSGHMQTILKGLHLETDKYLTALPNAGYPQNISNRMVFSSNISYFTGKMKEIAGYGVDIIGGCCGTTPAYIKSLKENISWKKSAHNFSAPLSNPSTVTVTNHAFYDRIVNTKQKLIAVELAPPSGSDDAKLMEAAHILKNSGVNVLTFPDSPSGRTRADSILMAKKVENQTGLCVMPHICCRDKNAIAIRSQLLGAHINDINHFLIITGDPIPATERQAVKSVFQFDSVGMMRILQDMNQEEFRKEPLIFGGAINQGRRNLDVEISRVKKKMQAGATFFLTQPVFTSESVLRIKTIKEETGARILCGIMPLVSLKNALFMKNEMTGIDVPDNLIARYEQSVTKEEGEAVGVAIAKEMMQQSADFVDGYYFSFPFNRVYLLEQILSN